MKLLGLRAKMTNETAIEIHKSKCRFELPCRLRRCQLANRGQLAWIGLEPVPTNNHPEELRVGRAKRALVTTSRESCIHHPLANATDSVDVEQGVLFWSRIRVRSASIYDEIIHIYFADSANQANEDLIDAQLLLRRPVDDSHRHLPVVCRGARPDDSCLRPALERQEELVERHRDVHRTD